MSIRACRLADGAKDSTAFLAAEIDDDGPGLESGRARRSRRAGQAPRQIAAGLRARPLDRRRPRGELWRIPATRGKPARRPARGSSIALSLRCGRMRASDGWTTCGREEKTPRLQNREKRRRRVPAGSDRRGRGDEAGVRDAFGAGRADFGGLRGPRPQRRDCAGQTRRGSGAGAAAARARRSGSGAAAAAGRSPFRGCDAARACCLRRGGAARASLCSRHSSGRGAWRRARRPARRLAHRRRSAGRMERSDFGVEFGTKPLVAGRQRRLRLCRARSRRPAAAAAPIPRRSTLADGRTAARASPAGRWTEPGR